MLLERTLNAKRNIFWGGLNRIIHIVFPFCIRTIIIYKLGIDYVGLNSLFTSLLSTLSLAELGFDTAIVTIMYKSVANNDNDALCALLKCIKLAYFVIGMVILFSGLCCTPFLKLFINDGTAIPSDINIYSLFLLFLFNTVATYFFGGYRACLLKAFQREDVFSNVNSVIYVFFFCIEAGTLFWLSNYYIYVLVMILSNICISITNYCVVSQKYSNIVPKGKINKLEKERLKRILAGTFLARLGAVLSVSADNIVISTFLGLSILGFYSNYTYITMAIQGFMVVIYTSIQAGIGNSIVHNTVEKNYNDMMKLTFLFNWIVGWCSICLFYLLNPFIDAWIGREGVVPNVVLCLIVLNFYLSLCSGVQGTYKNAIGIWWEDRYRTLIGGIFNFSLNIALVLFLKTRSEFPPLSGVVLSTILSLVVIQIPWSIKITFDKYFKIGMRRYCLALIFYFIVTILNIFLCNPILRIISVNCQGNNNLTFLFSVMTLILVPNIIYLLAYFKTSQFNPAFSFLKYLISKQRQ